jgi:hypothetical protein
MLHAWCHFNVVLTVFCAVSLVAFSAHSGDKGPGQIGKGE